MTRTSTLPPQASLRHLYLIGTASALLVWLSSVLGPYREFIDELYYLACARHLAWGYVDHPPLSIAILALVRAVAGDSLPVLRLVPALAAGATAVLTGLLARRLGAGRYGQSLAALGMATAGVPMVIFSFYSMNALDLVLWTLAFLVLVEQAGEPAGRRWLLFGLIGGMALLNKHTFVLLPVALLPSMLMTPARRQLASPYLWAGLGVAVLLLAPNLAWQASHGWPSLEFYANADLNKNHPTPPHEVLLQQVLFMNPAALPVWGAGLFFLLAPGRGGRWRHLGLVYVLLLAALALGQKSRPDRLTPVYPLLFAAGGAVWDAWCAGRRARRWRGLLPAGLLAGAAVFAPVGLPLAPPAFVAAYGARLGLVPQIEAGEGKRSALPQWLSDRLEWESFARDVEAVVATLPADERATAAIIVPSYGQAGALERFGRGLPPVYGAQNSYASWGPPPPDTTTLVVVGYSEAGMREWFTEVGPATVHDCRWCTPWRDGMPIRVVRGPLRPLAELWEDIVYFD